MHGDLSRGEGYQSDNVHHRPGAAGQKIEQPAGPFSMQKKELSKRDPTELLPCVSPSLLHTALTRNACFSHPRPRAASPAFSPTTLPRGQPCSSHVTLSLPYGLGVSWAFYIENFHPAFCKPGSSSPSQSQAKYHIPRETFLGYPNSSRSPLLFSLIAPCSFPS